MDSELEELFRRNQTNLTHIKQEIAVMKGEQSTSLIDEAPTPVKAPQERDPDVDTPMVRRPVRSNVPRPGTSEGRRLKCASSSSTARRPKTPSVAGMRRSVMMMRLGVDAVAGGRRRRSRPIGRSRQARAIGDSARPGGPVRRGWGEAAHLRRGAADLGRAWRALQRRLWDYHAGPTARGSSVEGVHRASPIWGSSAQSGPWLSTPRLHGSTVRVPESCS